ncbi:MAG: hypothetical protein JNM10_17965 [Planctomycetia bacterium]|nr:hypothetical protein [Planctomycetia bacterium]
MPNALRTSLAIGAAAALAALAGWSRSARPAERPRAPAVTTPAATTPASEATVPPSDPGRATPPRATARPTDDDAPDLATATGPRVSHAGSRRKPRVTPAVERDDPAAFPPLPPPGPMDWLAVHPEDGQSFEAFRVAPRRQVTEARRTLRVLPLDDLAAAGADVPTITAYLAAFYGLPSEPGAATAPATFTTRVNPSTNRTQVLTTDVLRWLPGEVASTDYCVLALTTRDLYPSPSWNFVFGEAALVEGVGVFSFARMDPRFPWPPDPARRDAAEALLVKRRCLKVVSHEVGHMFGLEHCVERRCLLNGCNHVAEMDATPMHLCPACLRKVVHATGLDVDARYRALLAWYRREGLDDEAAWVERRIAARAAPPPAAATDR